MRTTLCLAAIVAMNVVARVGADAETPPVGKNLLIKMRLCQGDPKGSVEVGTIKIVAEPNLVTLENRSFSVLAGSEVSVLNGSEFQLINTGFAVKGSLRTLKDGKVKLDLTTSYAAVGEETDDRLELHTASTRTISTLKLAEVVTFSIPFPPSADEPQAWVEYRSTSTRTSKSEAACGCRLTYVL